MKRIIILIISIATLIAPILVSAQAPQEVQTEVEETQPPQTDANVFGDVKSDGEHIPFVNI